MDSAKVYTMALPVELTMVKSARKIIPRDMVYSLTRCIKEMRTREGENPSVSVITFIPGARLQVVVNEFKKI